MSSLDGKRVGVFDIETDGLDLDKITTIHTLSIYDSTLKEYKRYDKERVKDGIKHLQSCDVIVGHNIINYDIPCIQKFYPSFLPKEVLDTLVYARLVYADILDIDMKLVKQGKLPSKLMKKHSLEAYGYRIGILKGDYGKDTDWQEWSEEMSEYCERDVQVTVALLGRLLSKHEFSQQAIDLEHKVAHIIKRQMDRGIYFDVKEAEALYLKLLTRREELGTILIETFGSWYEAKGKLFTPKRDNKKLGYVQGFPSQKIQLVEFNPNSRTHIYKVLIKKYGWKPTEFTPGGEPQINDDTFKALEKYPEASLLSEYLMLQKRIGQLAEGAKAWLKLVSKANRIHGQVITNGAVTRRMTHNNPNVAQVPNGHAPYGPECRALFQPTPGWLQVGCDASGLELRCLGHYMARYDGGAYVKEILEGDIHTANQLAAGLPTRNDAKTFIYAYLYGAGDEKIGSIVGGSKKEGRRLKKAFLAKTPALASLKKDIESTIKARGHLVSLDGAPLKIRSMHSALNTLLQSAGAIIMKQSLVILDEDLQDEGLVPGRDYEFMANIHDEYQLECRPEVAEVVGRTAEKAIEKAGVILKTRCPLAGEYKIGKSWAETH